MARRANGEAESSAISAASSSRQTVSFSGRLFGRTERGFDFLAIRTSIRDGKDAAQTEVLPLHCRGGRLAYGVAPIGKTVTTGASQALASSCGTAGGEADGPGHPAGETDTGGDGPCSICIDRCCANESDGKP